MSYQRGDIVMTLFPFADGTLARERPALLFAGPWRVSQTIEVCWCLMITTTVLRGWPGDLEIPYPDKVGLPVPSIFRTLKIACIDTKNITKKIGALDTKTFGAVREQVRAHFKKK